MNKLGALIDLLETKISFLESSKKEVSGSPVGWHIEHVLLTLDKIIDRISTSNPTEYRWKINFTRIIVLTTKKIPRGRAKSPEAVQPKGSVNDVSLASHFSTTRKKIKDLKLLPGDRFFDHPFFGHLKLKQAINFLEIHTKHHLAIIDDIIK